MDNVIIGSKTFLKMSVNILKDLSCDVTEMLQVRPCQVALETFTWHAYSDIRPKCTTASIFTWSKKVCVRKEA